MRALLIKDFLNLKEQLKFYVILMVVYGIFSMTSDNTGAFSGVLLMLIFIMIINTISYDERAKWDKFCLSTPVSRKTVVLEKYFLGVILFVIGGLVSMSVWVISEGAFDFVGAGSITLAMIIIVMIMLSIILPIIFKFGVEKGRILMIVVMLVPSILLFSAPFIADLLAGVKLPDLSQLNSDVFLIAGLIVAAVMYSISAMLSIRFYNKKEF